MFQGGIAMSYDANNQMIAQSQLLNVDGNQVEQKLIMDYKTVCILQLLLVRVWLLDNCI